MSALAVTSAVSWINVWIGTADKTLYTQGKGVYAPS